MMDELDILLCEMEEGLLFLDLTGKITRMNAASEILLGRESHEVLGKNVEQAFGPNPFGFSIEEILEKKSSPKPCAIDLNTPIGIERHLTINPLFIPGRGVLLLLHDRTEWQRLQEAAKRTRDFHLVHHTTSHIAHALKNPLSGIKGFATLLERDLREIGDEPLALCQKVVEGITSLEATLASLLDFTKGASLKREPVELYSLLTSLQERLSFCLNGEKGKLEADPLLLRVAFTNLINNALEASPDGKEVLVSIEGQELLKVTISDRGTGIPEKVLERLLDNPFSTKREGHGLGLTEAKEIVEAHGGHMLIASKWGEGTTITLTFDTRGTYAN